MTSGPGSRRGSTYSDSATTRAMRVVYASSIDRFGPLSHLRDLAPAVAHEGAEVKVLCLDEAVAASFLALGVEAVAAPLGSKRDLRGAAARVGRARGSRRRSHA